MRNSDPYFELLAALIDGARRLIREPVPTSGEHHNMTTQRIDVRNAIALLRELRGFVGSTEVWDRKVAPEIADCERRWAREIQRGHGP